MIYKIKQLFIMQKYAKTSNNGSQQNEGGRSSFVFNPCVWIDFDSHLLDILEWNTMFIICKMNAINSNLIAIILKNNGCCVIFIRM